MNKILTDEDVKFLKAFIAACALGVFLLVAVVFFSDDAEAQTPPTTASTPAAQTVVPPYWQVWGLLQIMRNVNYLPAWADFNDEWRFFTEGANGYICVTDSDTKDRFAFTGDRDRAERIARFEASALLEMWDRKVQPGPAGTFEKCFPPPKGPTALGEPRYRAFIRLPDGSPDLQAMAAYIAGPTTPGQACLSTPLPERTGSTDPYIGWYNMAAGGFSRCRL